MAKYLYGAAVQGIQSFIFATNKLKEMAGASELIEKICTEFYKPFVNADCEIILSAAGNIRLLFNTKTALEKLVLNFPKYIQEKVPGITIHQAVVEIDESPGTDAIMELEKRLNAQKNKQQRPFQIGLTITARCQRSGKPAVCLDANNKYLDKATNAKRLAAEKSNTVSRKIAGDDTQLVRKGETYTFPLLLEEISSKGNLNWLAVIHADGNNLGKTVQKLNQSLKDNSAILLNIYKRFSTALNQATIEAAREAFHYVIENADYELEGITHGKFPFRPIILGGDDLTVICRAELATQYTFKYLQEFQNKTRLYLAPLAAETSSLSWLQKGLTACAGIAYCKKSFPFHYAYQLAEELCKEAKSCSKQIARQYNLDYIPSSLDFHKMLSSYHTSYEDVIEKELTAPASQLQFNFGPYFIEKNKWNIPDLLALIDCTEQLKNAPTFKSGLRRWISELYSSWHSADLLIQRICDIFKEKEPGQYNDLDNAMRILSHGLSLCTPYVTIDNKQKKSPVAHILSILSVEGVI